MITFSDFTTNFKKKWKSIVFLTNLALFLGLGFSLVQPFLYKTNFSILIIQDDKDATDVYTAIKSADKLGSLIQKIVKTSEFHEAVMKSGYALNKEDFSDIEKKKRKQWNKMVEIGLVQEAGILDFNVYYKNKAGAEEYSKAIIHTIINDGSKFYGASSVVKFQVINSPMTSVRPAKPNLVINISFAIMVGFLSSLFYAYFTTTEKKKDDVEYDEDVYSLKIDNKELKKQEEKINKIDEVLEKDDINKKYFNLPNSKSNFIEPIVEEKKSNEVEEVSKKENIKQDVKIEVIEDEHIPQSGFIKNLNDRFHNMTK